MTPATLRLPRECLLSSGVEADEDDHNSKGSISIDVDGEGGGGGGVNTECTIYKGISSNGASGLKKGLRIETRKERWKNIHSLTCTWPVSNMESKAWS